MPEMTKKIADIVTYTGKVFEFLNPKPEMVCIEDIAHALANMCRYTGHVKQFYSVAQHSVLMANADLPGDPLVRLLHDSAEVYIGDMASPWKGLLVVVDICNEYYETVKCFEQRIGAVIGTALGVDLSPNPEIKLGDTRMFWTEVRDLMPKMPDDYKWGVSRMQPLDAKIIPWNPIVAEGMFLATYNKLKENL
uniref:HD domain-containing protein n=1 Tax=viral metagenome TaxID=1070528 RepID=A0A6M3KDF5_9ZZZZ